ncbi:MAG: protein-methionine-sulfoxide reductase heme-binding subunit MsrQ [Anaerolineae bacterium]|nr:sulfoxide reductase heme-binding subunit YedZ [Candidatus Roseilinea sp.]MDW8449151.1 protein-methionine-sulfoxide reductase heme-binding subunit MsrQ [Anaerolineae bacterium]
MDWLRRHWHRVLAHAAGLVPIAILAFDYAGGRLGAIPERAAMLRTGALSLALLIAAFACTPVASFSGWRGAVQIRRALGLYGFAYAGLHILIYAFYDGQLDLEFILRDLSERPAMSVGMAAFALLIPLALTSTSGWQRRLGKRWRTLHTLIYVAMPLSALHFLWLDRDILDAPIAVAVVIGLLLLARWPPLRRAVARLRRDFAR